MIASGIKTGENKIKNVIKKFQNSLKAK